MTRQASAPILCVIIVKRYSPKSLARKFQRKPHIAYHAPRYAQLLDILSRHKPAATAAGQARLLDVGRTWLTEILYDELMLPIDSIDGAHDDADHAFGRHFRFELVDAADRGRWRSDLPAYDLIVAAQVYDYPQEVAPRDVLAFLASVLKAGGLLVVQTPNPRALHHRARALLGKPPGRGYDRRQLHEAGDALRLETVEASFTRGFDYRFHGKGRERRWLGAAANLAAALAPPAMKPAFTIVFRKNHSRSSQPI